MSDLATSRYALATRLRAIRERAFAAGMTASSIEAIHASLGRDPDSLPCAHCHHRPRLPDSLDCAECQRDHAASLELAKGD